MSADLDKLQQLLSYQFADPQLAQQALTHRSAGRDNNERLEFLGDALLDFVIGEILYEQYPEAQEGELSRLRARMVNKSALAHIGRDLNLGNLVRLSSGEAKSGGKQRDSILADTVEALIAAVYLDGGLAPCKILVDRLTQSLQENYQQANDAKDAKTRLQEFLQASGHDLPRYKVTAIDGEAHDQVFHVQCHSSMLAEPTMGSGRSKRKAEQVAAQLALETLGGLS
jgi:ribonuclease-3